MAAQERPSQAALIAVRQAERMAGQTVGQYYRADHANRATPSRAERSRRKTDPTSAPKSRHDRKLAARAYTPLNPVRQIAPHRSGGRGS